MGFRTERTTYVGGGTGQVSCAIRLIRIPVGFLAQFATTFEGEYRTTQRERFVLKLRIWANFLPNVALCKCLYL